MPAAPLRQMSRLLPSVVCLSIGGKAGGLLWANVGADTGQFVSSRQSRSFVGIQGQHPVSRYLLIHAITKTVDQNYLQPIKQFYSTGGIRIRIFMGPTPGPRPSEQFAQSKRQECPGRERYYS